MPSAQQRYSSYSSVAWPKLPAPEFAHHFFPHQILALCRLNPDRGDDSTPGSAPLMQQHAKRQTTRANQES